MSVQVNILYEQILLHWEQSKLYHEANINGQKCRNFGNIINSKWFKILIMFDQWGWSTFMGYLYILFYKSNLLKDNIVCHRLNISPTLSTYKSSITRLI